MQVDFYQFSISWPRILPCGHVVNQAGIDYYNSLINKLIKNNIQPVVSKLHYSCLCSYGIDLGLVLN
jgi:beta-glucosidase/6-phospho-beta-glucosidase/beta-galactosidase